MSTAYAMKSYILYVILHHVYIIIVLLHLVSVLYRIVGNFDGFGGLFLIFQTKIIHVLTWLCTLCVSSLRFIVVNIEMLVYSTKLGKPQIPKSHQPTRQKTKTSKLPQRNLAAKYYGIQPPSWPDSK